MRHPLERLLSGTHNPAIDEGTANHSQWWDFSRQAEFDNFALHRLYGKGCCQGEKTTLQQLQVAQALVRRMTFVMDIDCLNDNMQALAQILGITLNYDKHRSSGNRHAPLEERYPFRDTYEYLAKRNRRDIELYEWSKALSLVPCDHE